MVYHDSSYRSQRTIKESSTRSYRSIQFDENSAATDKNGDVPRRSFLGGIMNRLVPGKDRMPEAILEDTDLSSEDSYHDEVEDDLEEEFFDANAPPPEQESDSDLSKDAMIRGRYACLQNNKNVFRCGPSNGNKRGDGLVLCGGPDHDESGGCAGARDTTRDGCQRVIGPKNADTLDFVFEMLEATVCGDNGGTSALDQAIARRRRRQNAAKNKQSARNSSVLDSSSLRNNHSILEAASLRNNSILDSTHLRSMQIPEDSEVIEHSTRTVKRSIGVNATNKKSRSRKSKGDASVGTESTDSRIPYTVKEPTQQQSNSNAVDPWGDRVESHSIKAVHVPNKKTSKKSSKSSKSSKSNRNESSSRARASPENVSTDGTKTVSSRSEAAPSVASSANQESTVVSSLQGPSLPGTLGEGSESSGTFDNIRQIGMLVFSESSSVSSSLNDPPLGSNVENNDEQFDVESDEPKEDASTVSSLNEDPWSAERETVAVAKKLHPKFAEILDFFSRLTDALAEKQGGKGLDKKDLAELQPVSKGVYFLACMIIFLFWPSSVERIELEKPVEKKQASLLTLAAGGVEPQTL